MGETIISAGSNVINYTEQLNELLEYMDTLGVMMIIILFVSIFTLLKKTNHSYEIRMAKWEIKDKLSDIHTELKTLNKNIEKLINKE